MTEARGEVFDLGYRGYDGPREGRVRAYKALWVNGVRTALGIGRSWGAKVMPALLLIAVISPALVGVLIASLAGPEDVISHSDYYSLVSIVLLLFSAIVAPELLCPDRRDRVLGLYLVRPLTTTDYVAARWLAFLSVTLPLVLAGQVVLFIGMTLAASDPVQYVEDNWLDVPRFILAGLVVAVYTTTVPLAVSAFTPRRAYAAALIIGAFIISLAVIGALTSPAPFSGDCERVVENGEVVRDTCPDGEYMAGDAAKWYALLSLSEVPTFVNNLVFDVDVRPGQGSASAVDELPAAVPIVWYVLLTSALGLALWWRYRRIDI